MAKRRDQGEGSVFLRERDGKYIARLDLGWVDGKRKRVERTAATKKEANEKLAVMKKAQEQGATPPSNRLTVSKYLDEWLEKVKRSRSHNTYLNRLVSVRHHLKPTLGNTPIAKLTVQQVEKLLFKLADEGLARNTINGVKGALQAALHDAERQGLILRNVAALATSPDAKAPEERKALSPDEAKALLAAIQDDRFEVLLTLMLSLGLRSGEARAVKWEDIDFTKATLAVRGNLQRVERKYIVQRPKTASSVRTLPLPPNLARLMRSHQAKQALDQRIAGEAWVDGGFVFTTETGGPVPERTFSGHFEKLLKAKGLPKVTPHELRHSCATILYVQGVDPKLIQAILGHSRLAITMDLYTHLLGGVTADALSRMDALIGGPG